MRCLQLGLLAVLLAVVPAHAATGKIVKVLPFLIDVQGRQSLSPSLFERDAYQAKLRGDPALCAGRRFDVQWKARQAAKAQLKVRVELVTTTATKDRPVVLEEAVRARNGWRRCTRLRLEGEAYRAAGQVIAWRAALWDGDRLLAEQRSFLW